MNKLGPEQLITHSEASGYGFQEDGLQAAIQEKVSADIKSQRV